MTPIFFLTQIRMTKIKTSRDNTCLQGFKQGKLHCLWVENLYNYSENQSGDFSEKMEIFLPEDPAILLLGIYPKDVPPLHKDTCSTMFHSSFIHKTQKLKTIQMSLNQGTDTEKVIHLYNGILHSY